MKLCFSNGTDIELELFQGALSNDLTKIYKHLQHAPLKFTKWDNPFYLTDITYNELIQNLVQAGKCVDVTVDPLQCIPHNQQYLNYLHKIYEQNYNGNSLWLDYHEQIHLCEFFHSGTTVRSVTIDYRERSSLLAKPFQNEYLSNSTTLVEPGTVYMEWGELGKIPYDYWADNEPNDITRLCELAKPWITFKPKFRIAMHQLDTMSKINSDFYPWWNQYEADWCKHWNLSSWSVENMYSVIKVGTIKDFDTMVELFNQRHTITAVRL